MTIRTAQLTVTTTAPLLLAPFQDAGYTQGSSIVVRNRGAQIVWLGGPNVNNTNGFELSPGDSFALDTQTRSDKLYGRTGTGTCVVYVFQSGV